MIRRKAERMCGEIVRQLEEFTGHSYENIPSITETPADPRIQTLVHARGQYTTKNMAILNNKPELAGKIYLDLDSLGETPYGVTVDEELEDLITHECVHGLHLQNNQHAEDFGIYIDNLEKANKAILFTRKYRDQNVGLDIFSSGLLARRYLKLLDIFNIYSEGFAQWLTEKVRGQTLPGRDRIYEFCLELFNTLEKAFGVEKTIDLAMNTSTSHEIRDDYVRACELTNTDAKEKILDVFEMDDWAQELIRDEREIAAEQNVWSRPSD